MADMAKKAFYRAYQKTFMVAECFFDWSEPELLKGPGAVKDLPALVKSKGISSVLVVTDKGLMSLNLLAGLFEQLDAQVGRSFGSLIAYFSWVCIFVTTAARVVSEPVPAVVGTAKNGGSLCLIFSSPLI